MSHPSSIHLAAPQGSLRESYARHVRGLLNNGEGRDDSWRAARSCLHQRGFDLRKIENYSVGYFPAADILWRLLLADGFSADEVTASNLLADSRLPGRLLGPIRDREGHILSFWAKDPQEPERCLYFNTEWKEQTAVFGLDVAYPAIAADRHDLLMVQDILDAVFLHAHGLPNVAAFGCSPEEMDLSRWERLADLGIHRATLVVDSFHDSHAAAIATIRAASRASRCPALYVLPQKSLDNAWLSGQAAKNVNQEALESSLATQRLHGFHYLALSLVGTHKPHDPWSDKARLAVLAEARKFYGTAHQRNVPQLDTFFLPPLLEALGLNLNAWTTRNDAWADDSPSANGRHHANNDDENSLEDEACAKTPPPSSAKPTVVASPEPPVKAATEVPSPADDIASRRAIRPGSDEYCTFHDCDRIVCLCWD